MDKAGGITAPTNEPHVFVLSDVSQQRVEIICVSTGNFILYNAYTPGGKHAPRL